MVSGADSATQDTLHGTHLVVTYYTSTSHKVLSYVARQDIMKEQSVVSSNFFHLFLLLVGLRSAEKVKASCALNFIP